MKICIGMMFQNEAEILRLHLPHLMGHGLDIGLVGLDGGSWDGGADVIREYGGVVYTHKYQWPSADQHNKLIEVCRDAGYDAMIKVDPDELLMPQCMADMVAALRGGAKGVVIPSYHFKGDRQHWNDSAYPDPHCRAWVLNAGIRHVGDKEGFHSRPMLGGRFITEQTDTSDVVHLKEHHHHLFHYGSALDDEVRRHLWALNVRRWREGKPPQPALLDTQMPKQGSTIDAPEFNGGQPMRPQAADVINYLERQGKRQTKLLYVIASVQRSGSGLLCDHLTAAGAGYPQEYLNKGVVAKERLNIPGAVGLMRDKQGHQVMGLNLFWSHIADRNPSPERWLDLLIANVKALDVRFIHLRREDKVAQAVSWQRVLAGGGWRSDKPGSAKHVKLAYRPSDITRKMDHLKTQDQRWQRWLSSRDAKWINLTYEKLTGNTEGSVDRVCEFLGFGTYQHDAVTRKKQAGDDVQAIIERYKRDNGLPA